MLSQAPLTNARKTPAAQRTKTKPAMAKPIAGRRMAIKAIVDQGKPNRCGRVDPAGRRGPRQRVSVEEIADRGREDFRARRNAIKRRRERVAHARRGDADDDNLAAHGLRLETPAAEPQRR